MLDLTYFEDGSVMASQLGKELLRQFAEKKLKEGEARGEKRGEKRGELVGLLVGKREAVLEVVALRLGAVPEGVREAVTRCRDLEALTAALRALVVGESVELAIARLR
jgi:predicted transposase YdaD